MSCEEHLVENIIFYIQETGCFKVKKDSKEYEEFYENYSKNGYAEVNKETFDWLVEMATYVVYESSISDADFSDRLHTKED